MTETPPNHPPKQNCQDSLPETGGGDRLHGTGRKIYRVGAMWRIELLGWLRACLDENVVNRFETQRTAVLLAYLALNRDRSHPKEELTEMLWPDSDPALTRPRLNQALYSLRTQFESHCFPKGSVFLSDRHTVQLNPASATTDVEDFERALRVARSQIPDQEKIASLKYSIGLYRGELLPGFYDPWISAARDQISDRHGNALKMLASISEGVGDLSEALEASRRLAVIEPLEEEHHAAVIRLHGLLGDPRSAMRQFRVLERILQEELGDVPTTATKNLIARVAKEPAGKGIFLTSQPTPAILADTKSAPQPSRLPGRLTRLFGRQEDIQEAKRLLLNDQTRLLTLFGLGGCGKTRLAIEIAWDLHDQMPNGVRFLSLAELTHAGQIPDAILRAVNKEFLGSGNGLNQAINALAGDGSRLLVLDNFEHLMEEGAILVRELLTKLPELKVIVTSRHRLSIEGERLLAVEPLPLPSAAGEIEEMLSSPSVQLFVDRVQAVSSGFVVTAENSTTIREICLRLEGIPLALELAAALTQTTSLAQIALGIEHRFTLLIGRQRDLPERHRSMRAALEYGYQMLPPELQGFFVRLSVFHGGWTVASATYICRESQTAEYLAHLVERSLLQVDLTNSTGMARYTMLETLREFGWQRLTADERFAARNDHAEWLANFAEEAAQFTSGPDRASWIAQIEADRGNLLAALEWSEQTGKARTGLRIASNLQDYWEAKGPIEEGREWLKRLLAIKDRNVSPAGRAQALSALGRLAWFQADYPSARDAHEEALRIFEEINDLGGTAKQLYSLGIVMFRLGEYDSTRVLMERSLGIAGEIGDRAATARALLNLGNVARERGEFALARRYFDEAYALEESLGNQVRAIGVLNNLGDLAFHQKNNELAIRYFQDCLVRLDSVDNLTSRAMVLNNMGVVLGRVGRLRESVTFAVEALELSRAVGFQEEGLHALINLARSASLAGDGETAATLIGVVNSVEHPSTPTLNDEWLAFLSESESEAKTLMGAESFESSHGYGRSLLGDRGHAFALQWAKAFPQSRHAISDSF